MFGSGETVVDQDLEVLQLQIIPVGTHEEDVLRGAQTCFPPGLVQSGGRDGVVARSRHFGPRWSDGGGRNAAAGRPAPQCRHGRDGAERAQESATAYLS